MQDAESHDVVSLENQITERYGLLISQTQLAELLGRTTGGLRYSLSVDLHSILTHLPPIFALKIDPRVNPFPLTEQWEIKRSDQRGFIECNTTVVQPGQAADPGDCPAYGPVPQHGTQVSGQWCH